MRPTPILFIACLASCFAGAPPDEILEAECLPGERSSKPCPQGSICLDDHVCHELCERSRDCREANEACIQPDGVCMQYGETCDEDHPCLEGFYCTEINGVCHKVPEFVDCENRVEDGGESDIDCGGPYCPGCDPGEDCTGDSDCTSLVCSTTNTCEPPTCVDHVENGDETDEDCGGPSMVCPRCNTGFECYGAVDCESGVCTGEVCLAPTCSDGVVNGTESDVDCGVACPLCANGRPCNTADDCVSGVCSDVCQAPTCNDETANGEETDVDCGGACPLRCADNASCLTPTDCISGVCTDNICQPPTCVDEIPNGDETDVDCGGASMTCPRCGTGKNCDTPEDCASGVCGAGGCIAPDCNDSVQNAAETDVDCGGTQCQRCGGGMHCSADTDCLSRRCADGSCAAPPTAVVAGFQHSCAVLDDGTAKCWGLGSLGQLGLGDPEWRGDDPDEMGGNLPAVELGNGGRVASIAAGGYHTCGLFSDETIKCWGANGVGQLGHGDTEDRGDEPNEMGDTLPLVNLGNGETAIDVTLGYTHTCALLSGGVKCWGWNGEGQTGAGDTLNRGDELGEMGDLLPFVDLGTGRTAIQIDAGGGHTVPPGYIMGNHTCALLDNAVLKCWGDNRFGQLGVGDTEHRGDGPGEMGDLLPPVDLGIDAHPVAVATGGSHTCGLLADGSVRCWGFSWQGPAFHVGDEAGEMGDSLAPIHLWNDRIAREIDAGGNQTCAILDDGSVKCWIAGTGGYSNGNPVPPVDLGTDLNAIGISVGGYHACAFFDDQSVKCWGQNTYGQLGLGISDAPTDMGDALERVDL